LIKFIKCTFNALIIDCNCISERIFLEIRIDQFFRSLFSINLQYFLLPLSSLFQNRLFSLSSAEEGFFKTGILVFSLSFLLSFNQFLKVTELD
jgi:hypothetical protein